jgi:hypothetical protein
MMRWELWSTLPWFCVQAAFLVTLFWIAASKPELIHRPRQFRIACMVFATTFVAPALAIIALYDQSRDKPPSLGDYLTNFIAASIVGPALMMVSFLLAIESIAPRLGKKQPPPSPPDSDVKPRKAGAL